MSEVSNDHVLSALAAMCREDYPSLHDQRIENLARISDGWECEVYRFDLNGLERDAAKRLGLILRIYQGNGAARKARDEFRVLRSLGLAGYPVPRVDAVYADDSPLGRPLTVMERIDGEVLGNAIERAAGAERAAYLQHFARLLLDLHQVDWRPYVPDPSQYVAASAVGGWLAEVRGVLRSLNAHDFDEAVGWLEEQSGVIVTERLAIVHWDFHPWNVLLRSSGGAAVVIDWTSAQISDARFDLAWTLLLLRASLGREFRDATLAAYERLAGQPIPDLGFFEAAASLRRVGAILISLAGEAEKLGLRGPDEAQRRDSLHHLGVAYDVLRERTGLRLPIAERILA
jgi:aminoglycoside phosphotransferase (APT) family kinase protein